MQGHELPGIPGLLDPLLVLSEPSALPDLQIAPLRNPEPIRHSNAPVPLEPVAKTLSNDHQGRTISRHRSRKEGRSPSNIKPSDVLLARDAKKPHLAISELVETNQDELHLLQLPSFVSLSVVEKSPIPQPSQINPYKRLRLENDVDIGVVEMHRVLPRPSKKDNNQARPVPLLPAMVTGLHEPPPSARLLPSMSDAQPELGRPTTASKMNVKEMLAEIKHASKRRPPETMLNSPDTITMDPPHSKEDLFPYINKDQIDDREAESCSVTNNENKSRRQYHKWTDRETADLISGVRKYGSGKWKQILSDPAFSFGKRTAVDLKDRFRVLPKDSQDTDLPSPSAGTFRQQDNLQDQLSKAATNETLITSPRHRKKRQRWTFAEDAALMAGVTKHGFQWSAIHADPEMEWGSRRPTDLRDRIRTLFPEGYRRADTRPLAKQRDKAERPQCDNNDAADQWDGSSPSNSRSYNGNKSEPSSRNKKQETAGGLRARTW